MCFGLVLRFLKETVEKCFDNEDSPVNKSVSWRVLLNVFWLSFEVLRKTEEKCFEDDD